MESTFAQPSTLPKVNEDSYKLAWSDEFDQDGPPNADNWTYEHGFERNEELQWYQEENAVCRDGFLIIEARQERIKNPRYRTGARDWRRSREFAEYTSACLLTKGKHEWKYGRFVMRGRIDVRPGLWPAFWTLGSARRWPGCGEIDVMEYYAGGLLANVCWQGKRYQPVWDALTVPLEDFTSSWADEFHVWQLDWNPREIKIFVDGKLLNQTSLKKAINLEPPGTEPFQEPHFLLLNLAIGGIHGGDPATTKFPARFEVDYVRVYQQPEQRTE
ncbi:MAG: glycoside hydrolase family 16 protein [Bythopirellula sp.]|nr:glycoside hydrolase family 16 protein [Bythopirellula sp.]